MGDFFYKTYLLIEKRRWASLFALLFLVISLGAIASRIEFDDDITALIPATKDAKKVQEILESIAFTDKIIVNIRREGEGSVEELTQYAGELLDSLEHTGDTYIKNVQGKLNDDDLPNTLSLVYNNLPLFLDDFDYKKYNGCEIIP